MPGSTTVINKCTGTISSEPCSNATCISWWLLACTIRIWYYVFGVIIAFWFHIYIYIYLYICIYKRYLIILYTFTWKSLFVLATKVLFADQIPVFTMVPLLEGEKCNRLGFIGKISISTEMKTFESSRMTKIQSSHMAKIHLCNIIIKGGSL